ncbi:MAG TPA: PP2C family protein-serine/threonine phosphatase [Terriglobales bacterium]|nr:PP2C family protein-serine/threonine phosphatase [Terriglobales bacterium]
MSVAQQERDSRQLPAQPGPPPREPNFFRRIENFWERVTEGLELEQLWAQFKQEARVGYQLYSREVQPQESRRTARDWFQLITQFFWSIIMKLSPAKRVLLLVGLALMLIPGEIPGEKGPHVLGDFHFYGALIFLLLLVLEIADRVTMKRDLQIAREIQMWLVPEVSPALPGLDVAFITRPANTVAGDYYDIFLRDGSNPGKVLMAVADVAGKSVPAALLMATFQASLRTLSATSSTMPELAAGLNKYACENSRGGVRFTTAFLAEFDPTTRELTYSNAGHNAPMLRRVSGAMTRLEAGGLPLGIQQPTVYQTAIERLSPGDMLLIFTDGVIEAVNESGQEYGEDRLKVLLQSSTGLAASAFVDRLMRDLDAFTGAASQHDDITCMVVRLVETAEGQSTIG